ncbi:hypothetical protein EC915_11387 [Pseudomonas sp. LP_7_YM]|nr:hypothetical protein EC915_11387 [Pseudomonas sp. LP_7_YM]
MDGGGFFHEPGVESLDNLIALVYDLAYFWKVDPEQMMARPLDIFLESLAQAQRINRTLQVD